MRSCSSFLHAVHPVRATSSLPKPKVHAGLLPKTLTGLHKHFTQVCYSESLVIPGVSNVRPAGQMQPMEAIYPGPIIIGPSQGNN